MSSENIPQSLAEVSVDELKTLRNKFQIDFDIAGLEMQEWEDKISKLILRRKQSIESWNLISAEIRKRESK